MNRFVLLVFLFGIPVYANAASTDTANAAETSPVPARSVMLDRILLTAEEVAPACKMTQDRHPVRSEAQVFYEHGINSMRLPLVFSKADQGFVCGRDKGVVYYIQYVDPDGRKNAELAARTSLWKGDTQATSRNPEQIFGWDKFLIIVSFKAPAWKPVMAPLVKKLKALQAAQPS
jgi:hypothetical protein